MLRNYIFWDKLRVKILRYIYSNHTSVEYSLSGDDSTIRSDGQNRAVDMDYYDMFHCFIVSIPYGGFSKLIKLHHLFGNICEHVPIEKLVHSKEWTEIAHLHSLRKDENHIPNHCWKRLCPVWGGCNLLGLYVFLKTDQPMLKLHCVGKKTFAMIWSSGQVSSYLRQCINQSERL